MRQLTRNLKHLAIKNQNVLQDQYRQGKLRSYFLKAILRADRTSPGPRHCTTCFTSIIFTSLPTIPFFYSPFYSSFFFFFLINEETEARRGDAIPLGLYKLELFNQVCLQY